MRTRNRKSSIFSKRRVAALSIAASLAFAACGSTNDSADSDTDDGRSGAPADSANADDSESDDSASGDSASDGPVVVETERIEPGPKEDVPSGLRTFGSPTDDLPPPGIDLSRLRSGGPPPDGIPSVDEPIFYSAASVDYMEPNSPVLSLEINGDARAYPLDVMVWHEIVNDTVGGVPVAVEYCPLCNSATVFDRRIEGRVLEFGVSGLLFNSSLVMYDRQTETLWSHFAGVPIYGELFDAELVDYPTTIVGFGEWREANPDGLVMSRETGSDRNYGVNPYIGYDDINASPFLFEGEVDGRYTAMTRVVGLADGIEDNGTDGSAAVATAFPLLELREAGTLTSQLDGKNIVAFWIPGSSSALDTAAVDAGVDVGATGVFIPEAGGQDLTFVSTDGVITDNETGSAWNIFGEATSGDLAGEQLEQLIHIDTFWFAWITFHPDSDIATS